jgi:excisionase family DNA binding protein
MSTEKKQRERLEVGDILTLDQVAKLLQVSTRTLRTWLKAGKFKHATKIGRAWRIPSSDLEGFFWRS